MTGKKQSVTSPSTTQPLSSSSPSSSSRRSRVELLKQVVNSSTSTAPHSAFNSNSLKRTKNHSLLLNSNSLNRPPSSATYGRLVNGSLKEESIYGQYISPSRMLLLQSQGIIPPQASPSLNPHQTPHQHHRQPSSPRSNGANGHVKDRYMSNIRTHQSTSGGDNEKIYSITDGTSAQPKSEIENVYATIPVTITIRKPKKKSRLKRRSFFDDPQRMFQFIQSTLIITNLVTLFLGITGLIAAGFIDPVYKLNTTGGQLCLISIFIIITSLTGLYGSRRESCILLIIYGSLILASLLTRSILYFISLHFISTNHAFMIALSMMAALIEVVLILAAFAFAAEVHLKNNEDKVYDVNPKHKQFSNTPTASLTNHNGNNNGSLKKKKSNPSNRGDQQQQEEEKQQPSPSTLSSFSSSSSASNDQKQRSDSKQEKKRFIV